MLLLTSRHLYRAPLAGAFALAILAGCIPHPADTPAPPPPPPQPAEAASAKVDEQIAIEPALTNRLLQISPDDFLKVIGDCGEPLLSEKPQADKAQACLLQIRERAKTQGVGEISEADIAHPFVAKRWRFQVAQTKP